MSLAKRNKDSGSGTLSCLSKDLAEISDTFKDFLMMGIQDQSAETWQVCQQRFECLYYLVSVLQSDRAGIGSANDKRGKAWYTGINTYSAESGNS